MAGQVVKGAVDRPSGSRADTAGRIAPARRPPGSARQLVCELLTGCRLCGPWARRWCTPADFGAITAVEGAAACGTAAGVRESSLAD